VFADERVVHLHIVEHHVDRTVLDDNIDIIDNDDHDAHALDNGTDHPTDDVDNNAEHPDHHPGVEHDSHHAAAIG